MEEDKDIKSTFQNIADIADIGKELFSDFLSELTRQRQLYVLLSSTIAILLAYPYIKNIQGDLGGIKISFIDLSVAKHIAGWICTYFVLVYFSSAIQDMQYYRYKITWSQLQLDMMLRTQTLNSQIAELQKMMELLNREEYMAEAIRKSLELKPGIRDRLKTWFQNVKKVVLSMIFSLLDLFLMPRHALDREVSRQIEKSLANNDFVKILGMTVINGQLDEKENRLREEMTAAIKEREYKSLQEIKTRYDVVNRMRLFLEVFFPIGISCFAIWASLLK